MREIRGWNIGQVVTMAEMTLDTANVLEEIGSNGKANLPCIYNGLSLQSQSGTGGSIVTFNPGVARCQDLPTSIYTYLPSNSYGNSYPCFIDISALDANQVITLSTGITSGYIVATFAISPNTPGAVDYVITGSLLQIATGSYNPAIHVRLCAFTYSAPNFTLDFTPGTSRDTDLTGAGGVQWDYQTSRLVINTPQSQSGTSGVYFPNKITPSSFIAPTQQILDSAGAGTYTAPALRPLYLEVEIYGPGGGGSSGGTTGNDGDFATSTTFGTSLLIAEGGGKGEWGGVGGSGGYGTINSPAYGVIYLGQTGEDGFKFQFLSGISLFELAGGQGGSNGFALGSLNNSIPGFIGIGGGGCGGLASITAPGNYISGSGGGAGGYLKAIIPNPSPTYSFFIGSPGVGGAIGLGGRVGRDGEPSKIIVTEYYS